MICSSITIVLCIEWHSILFVMLFVLAYMYANPAPRIEYGIAIISAPDMLPSLIVCSIPNRNPEITINSVSFFMNLLMQPLNNISSTIGARNAAKGNVYHIGNASICC